MVRPCLAAVALAAAINVTAYAEEAAASWPTEFDGFSGRHRTLANRVLAFEARAVGPNIAAAVVLDDLLDEAVTLGLEGRGLHTRQQVVDVLQSIDMLLVDNGFVYPPCRLVETLSDALAPRSVHSQNRKQLLAKNSVRKYHVINTRHRVLHYSDCDTTALLYLSIAELIGLPLQIVDLPTHIFLRYRFKDGTYLNWDPLEADEVSDAEHVSRYDVSPRDVASGRYLRPFTILELAGYLLLIRGKQFANRGKWSEAEYDYRRSIALYPQDGQARYELSMLHFVVIRLQQTAIAEGIVLAREAVEINPRNSAYLNILACLLALTGDFAEASGLEERASALEDDRQAAEFYASRACAFAQRRSPFEEQSDTGTGRQAQCTW